MELERLALVHARNGAKLILNARRGQRLEALAAELKEGSRASSLVLPFDVRDFKLVKKALEGLPSEWDPITVLINNAGLARSLDKLYEGSVEDWEEMIDSNIKGLLYVTRLVVPGMVKREGSCGEHCLYRRYSDVPPGQRLLLKQGGCQSSFRRVETGLARHAYPSYND